MHQQSTEEEDDEDVAMHKMASKPECRENPFYRLRPSSLRGGAPPFLHKETLFWETQWLLTKLIPHTATVGLKNQ